MSCFEPRNTCLSNYYWPEGEPEMSAFDSAFLCGLVKHNEPHKIAEVGVAGDDNSNNSKMYTPVRDKIRTMRAVWYPQCNTPEWSQVCCQRNNMLQVPQ